MRWKLTQPLHLPVKLATAVSTVETTGCPPTPPGPPQHVSYSPHLHVLLILVHFGCSKGVEQHVGKRKNLICRLKMPLLFWSACVVVKFRRQKLSPSPALLLLSHSFIEF
ncbi:hypothetical protein BC830DRAFT_937268 [Chytriomyces sp. MP71]|nr:hypothetical protein BC830DRAFT_937268 [Chytriomyces sp. MP71]